MTLDKFRIYHSTIIEHYQYIEHHLAGIYAKLCGESFYISLKTVEKCNINQLINSIKKIENENNLSILSEIDYTKLEHIRLRRNYWCHACYTNMIFDKNDLPQKKHIDCLLEDLREAESLRESLFQKKTNLR